MLAITTYQFGYVCLIAVMFVILTVFYVLPRRAILQVKAILETIRELNQNESLIRTDVYHCIVHNGRFCTVWAIVNYSKSFTSIEVHTVNGVSPKDMKLAIKVVKLLRNRGHEAEFAHPASYRFTSSNSMIPA